MPVGARLGDRDGAIDGLILGNIDGLLLGSLDSLGAVDGQNS